MPTTTNNGWPTPADTDLVKNGADAIRDLGQAIDTTLGVYSSSTPGLVKINTTTFSGVSSVSLPNDTFTSTHKNYRIILNVETLSTTLDITSRFRTAGSNNTTANYNYFLYTANSSASTDVLTSARSATSATIKSAGVTSQYFVLDVMNPQATFITSVTGQGNELLANLLTFGFGFGLTTSFDSMSFIASTGTISGVVSCYGYQS